jgi:hypothetical protein
MRRAILTAVVALSLIGGARADEAQVFHLRGECNQLAKAFFEKQEEKADFDCAEYFFKGSNYNVKDNRCYLQMRTIQDDVINNNIIERNKLSLCRMNIKEGINCTRTLLIDVQTEESIAVTWDGKCASNRDKNAYEKYGIIPSSAKKATFLGFELSLSSEYTQALDFIKSKMEENYRD